MLPGPLSHNHGTAFCGVRLFRTVRIPGSPAEPPLCIVLLAKFTCHGLPEQTRTDWWRDGKTSLPQDLLADLVTEVRFLFRALVSFLCGRLSCFTRLTFRIASNGHPAAQPAAADMRDPHTHFLAPTGLKIGMHILPPSSLGIFTIHQWRRPVGDLGSFDNIVVLCFLCLTTSFVRPGRGPKRRPPSHGK